VASDRAVERRRPPSGDAVAALAAALGGGEEAVAAARLIVAEQAFRASLSGDDATGATVEDELNGVN
jgi:hypothetical protein